MTDTTNKEAGALKPCPFCGGHAEIEMIEKDCFGVGCPNCDFQLMNGPWAIGWHRTQLGAATEWNRRSPAEVQAEKDAKTAELHKMLANIMHDQTTAMQSALIEWKHGNGAEAGLQWIVNTLMGPGLLPDFDAEHGTNAQFWFDANRAEPFPKCFCGNPSHMLWMGQGFCCDAHYDEAKAKRDTAPSTGDQS